MIGRGNVRELRNAIERAVLLSAVRPGARFTIDGLHKPEAPKPVEGFDPNQSFGEAKEMWIAHREHSYLQELLSKHEGNISAAARAARMDRKYLHKILRKHDLP